MSFTRTILPVAIFLLTASITSADTITSTASGGPWSDSYSWTGGVLPGAYDDVIIVGPIQVDGAFECRSLTVDPAGSVTAATVSPPIMLTMSDAVINNGLIDNGVVWLDLEIGGDLHNAGTWITHMTTLTGNGDRQISDTSFAGIDSDIEVAEGASGNLTAITPVALRGFVDLTGLPMILSPDSHLTLVSTIFSGEVQAAGNEIRFLSWSYLNNTTIDDAVLVGEARAAFNVYFTTRVEVRGSLMNTTSTGGGRAVVEGDLINHGVIRNDHYSFFFSVHGDIENYGTLDVPILSLIGDGATHRLTMGPAAILEAPLYLPEFVASTLILTTPAIFGGGLGLGVGTLVLEPGVTLHFPVHSGLNSGTIEANGNSITTATGNSGLSSLTIDNGVIGDYAAFFDDVRFTNGLTVDGHLSGWPWAEADLVVEDRLRNEGTISDGDHPVRVTVLNDLENLGAMTNQRVTVAGSIDQSVAVGPGIAVPEFVLDSMLNSAGYQWYRDGEVLHDETGSTLTFNTVGPAEYGRYHCVGDGLVSRNVFIAETITTTDVPGFASVMLERNHPNPFNPATNIAFTLDRSGPVSLVVFDLAGREVDRLVSGERGAGRHVITWQPRGLASGTYVYRLRANGIEAVRKCSLLK